LTCSGAYLQGERCEMCLFADAEAKFRPTVAAAGTKQTVGATETGQVHRENVSSRRRSLSIGSSQFYCSQRDIVADDITCGNCSWLHWFTCYNSSITC